MALYLVTSDFIHSKTKGEQAAMPCVSAYATYMMARRSIQGFTSNWDVKPVMHRKIVPLRIIKDLQKKNIDGNPTIASFVGTRKGIKVWFTISMINPKLT